MYLARLIFVVGDQIGITITLSIKSVQAAATNAGVAPQLIHATLPLATVNLWRPTHITAAP